MELTATGTAVNFNQGIEVPFTLKFALTGGKLQTAGCDSALVNAQVTDFSAVIGGQHFAAPSSFLANFGTSPWPTCSSPTLTEITNVAPDSTSLDWLTLEYWVYPGDPLRHSMFSGNIGNWYLANANYSVVNNAAVPEPSTAVLLGTALIVGIVTSRIRTLCGACAVLAITSWAAGCATAPSAADQVRVTNSPADVEGCTLLGKVIVGDTDAEKNSRAEVVRLGGNMLLKKGPEVWNGNAYHCPAAAH